MWITMVRGPTRSRSVVRRDKLPTRASMSNSNSYKRNPSLSLTWPQLRVKITAAWICRTVRIHSRAKRVQPLLKVNWIWHRWRQVAGRTERRHHTWANLHHSRSRRASFWTPHMSLLTKVAKPVSGQRSRTQTIPILTELSHRTPHSRKRPRRHLWPESSKSSVITASMLVLGRLLALKHHWLPTKPPVKAIRKEAKKIKAA